MTAIRLTDVTVTYDLLTVEDYNLKRRVLTGLGRKRFRARHDVLTALDAITLDLTSGTRLGVVGSNGAGKSTLLRVMSGALPPARGRVEIEGRVFCLLGSSGAGLDFGLTGYENVIMTGVLLGEGPRSMRRRMDEIAEVSGLGERLRNPVGTYSTGMQARLRFAILTSLRPQILVMDEGVASADIAFTERTRKRMDEFQSEAEIVVTSSHSPAIALLCDTVLWLEGGQVMAYGPAEEVVDAYLTYALAPQNQDQHSDKHAPLPPGQSHVQPSGGSA